MKVKDNGSDDATPGPDTGGKEGQALRVHQIELEMQNQNLRATQAELDAARSRYFDLYDLAPVGYFTISEKGLILEANLTATTLLGITRRELIKQPISRFIRIEEQDIHYRHRKLLFETGDPCAYDLRMVKKDGTPFWAHLTATVAQEADNSPVVRIVITDITERKLREDEREMTAQLIVRLTTPGDFRKRISELTASLQGWSGCEAVGIRLRTGDDYPYYETRGFPPTFVQAENSLCAYGPNGRILRDGAGNPVLECMCGNILSGRFDPAKPFFTTHGSFWSNNTTALSQCHAVEEMLASRAKLKAALASMTDAVFISDAEGRFIEFNDAFATFHKFKNKEQCAITFAEYPELLDVFMADGEPAPLDQWAVPRALRGETGRHIEYSLRRKDTGETWVGSYNFAPIRDGGGAIVGSVVTANDITERKLAEEEKAELHARLQQAQKMEAIGTLAGGIAHDLNNILYPIIGFSEILQEDIPPESPMHEIAEQIFKSAQRGSDLVKQVPAFSRQTKILKQPIRIQQVLKEALKLVRATIPMNIEITSHINMDCGLASADSTQVHQVVMNLITNAYHAVEGNGGTILVELKETVIGRNSLPAGENEDLPFHDMKPGRYACVTVSDTGTGMDQVLIGKIFDPYFTTKAQGKGSGLGLSVVHGIVKEHGGNIRVHSQVGKGTTFHVYLPLLRQARESRTAAVARKFSTGSERILLVDDEAPVVRMEQMMLERLGYRVTARTGSLEALDTFKDNPDDFDLVISDRGMPDMTGEQLAGELMSIRPGIPIVLCTGFSSEIDEQRSRNMGIRGLLIKPLSKADLAEMVRKVLDEASESVSAHAPGQADAAAAPVKSQLKDHDND